MQTYNSCLAYTFRNHSSNTTTTRLRAARACNGKSVDQLHALAFHQYRATHKTKSQLISLLHLVSVYGTHPELREWLQATQSAVMVRVAAYLDRLLEKRNDLQKERNTSRLHILNGLHYTKVQPALQHVQSTWRSSQIDNRIYDDTGVRMSMVNEVEVLVKLFVEKIGTDLATRTKMNNLWHTGNPRKMCKDYDSKEGQPWEYVKRVAASRSVGAGCKKAQWWHDVAQHLVQECMFGM